MGWCTQHLTYFMMDELKLCKAMGKVTLRLRYVLGSCAVSCKNVYSFFIHMIHILPCSQQVCQSVWKSLKKSRKLIIFEKVDLQREEILQFAWKWKWDIFDGFQTLCAPFPYLMHQKLTTSFFRLYHHSITLLLPWKKSFFSFPREFSTYMGTLLKNGDGSPKVFSKS